MDNIEWLVMQLLECSYEDINGKVSVGNIRLTRTFKKEKLLKNYSNKIIDLSGNEKYSEVLMDEISEENVAKQMAYLVGRDDGKEEGIKEGILEKEKEVVLNMYKDNVNLETISKYIKLTSEEIEEIIKSNN